jgi:hypothetical protein
MLLNLLALSILISQSKDAMATQVVLTTQTTRAESRAHPSNEELWWGALAPIAQLSGDELYRQAAKHLDLRILNLSLEAGADEKEKVTKLAEYWAQVKRRSRLVGTSYSALYLPAHQDLPGPYAHRAWKDEAILIVDQASSRESVFHLLLHHLNSNSDLAASKNFQQKQVLEVQQDLFLLERRQDFDFSEGEWLIILQRTEMNLQRLEESLAFLDVKKEDEQKQQAEFTEKLEQLKKELSILKSGSESGNKQSVDENQKGARK